MSEQEANTRRGTIVGITFSTRPQPPRRRVDMGMRRLRQTDSDPGRPRLLFAPDPSVSRLTARELAVARLVADGLKDGAIARRLSIATSSAAGYVARVKRRLGLSRRDEIAAWVRARRVADDPETPLQRVEAARAVTH
jgi:DNA-binding CsgD family transcriptional regulator